MSFGIRDQKLCERRGGRPGLPSLIVLMVSVDVKQHWRRKRTSLNQLNSNFSDSKYSTSVLTHFEISGK